MKCDYPITNVHASSHEDLLDAAILKDFGHYFKVFSNWFKDRKSDIFKDEGADKYEE